MSVQGRTPSVAGLEELVAVLGASIGDDKARQALAAGAEALQLDARVLTREQALGLLDHLAGTPGIVGVSSKFGRSRLMLKWTNESLRTLSSS